jgi:tetratricopeptide (TPR) repeat protein
MQLIACLLAACLLLGCGPKEKPLSSSNQKFLEAKELIAKGQKDEALAALDASIKEQPSLWALRERAKLHAERGEDQAAREDCDAALAITPDDADALWIKAELAKPKAQRFQGAAKNPPSHKH